VDDRLLSGRYKIVNYLSKGGCAQTYLAEDTLRPHKPLCVVKQLQLTSEDTNFIVAARRLFQQEAEILEKLGTHPQIPQLLAYFEERGEFFLVQEYINGQSITKEIQNKDWQETEVIEFIAELLELLIFVHSHNVIHRDIKPDNLIRRQQDGKLVLIDFGAVKEITRSALTVRNTCKTTIGIGTIGYMPPEQITGKPRFCSDIYAIGITAIQALTGESPQQLNYDEDGEVIWSPRVRVSHKLIEFLNKTVRYYIKDRYQTATEALNVLQELFPIKNLVASRTEKAELNLAATIFPTTTIINTVVNPIETVNNFPVVTEVNIPQTIVVSNPANTFIETINKTLIYFKSTRHKKPILFGVGLAAILTAGAISINNRTSLNRPSIVLESPPSIPFQSAPIATSEPKQTVVATPKTETISKTNTNNNSEAIGTNTNSQKESINYRHIPTNTNNSSTQISERQITTKQTTENNSSNSSTTTSSSPKTTPTKTTENNKTQTNTKDDRAEEQKTTAKKSDPPTKRTQTTTRNNSNERRTPTTTRSNSPTRRTQTTTRNNSNERRTSTTTRSNLPTRRTQTTTRNNSNERRTQVDRSDKKGENDKKKKK
jgi:serine/threonine protein kinase